MKQKQFKTLIAAPREKVWDVLWNNNSYPQWTEVFSPGSRAETDWKKGSKVLFLDASNGGMVSLIADKKDNELMSFKHIGICKDGKELINTKESQQWEGFENYTLRQNDGKTELIVDLSFGDISNDFIQYFEKTFPKALDKVKSLSEG